MTLFPKIPPARQQLMEEQKKQKRMERKLKKESRKGEADRFGGIFKRTLCRMNHHHRSGEESEFCDEMLQPRVWAKEIEILRTEKQMRLSRGNYLYIADWECRDLKTGEIFYVEFKGKEMERWATTVRMWKAYGPGKLYIWKKNKNGFFLYKTLIPETGGE